MLKNYTQLNKMKKEKVLFICPIYNSYPQIISALICQTYTNWELWLIHDGPNNTNLEKIIDGANDPRIKYIIHPQRKNDWGHSLRKWALEAIKLRKVKCEYIVITNPDNYYVPVFIEVMLTGFTNNNIIATYCHKFVHGYLSPQPEGNHRFGVLESKLQLGYLDCGGVMVRKENACAVGWRSLEIYSDWTYFEDLITRFGESAWKKVLGCLFVHS